VIVQAAPDTMLDPGTRVGLTMAPEKTYLFDAETGVAQRARERITLP
jgi:sn-glycerol 3-phosphate transport system ATP-binding protein